MENPCVTVLILSFNGKHLLKDAIDSYKSNTYSNFSIIVIDNGSTDGTLDYMHRNYPDIKVLRTEVNKGYSGGFNIGIEYSFRGMNSDYILISNNDVVADKNLIEELVKIAVTDDYIGFTVGKVYYYDDPDVFQTVGMLRHPVKINGGHIGKGERDRGQYDMISERDFADDVFTLVSKKLYDSVGSYDTNFRLQAEQFDWQMRAKKNGFKIMYTPYARLWHKDSMTIGKHSAVKSFNDARNSMLIVLKYSEAVKFRKYFWVYLRDNIIRNSLVNFKNKDFDIAKSIWQGFFSAIEWGFNNRILTWKHFF